MLKTCLVEARVRYVFILASTMCFAGAIGGAVCEYVPVSGSLAPWFRFAAVACIVFGAIALGAAVVSALTFWRRARCAA